MVEEEKFESAFSVLLPEIIQRQDFISSPDACFFSYAEKTIFELDGRLCSFLIKACPGIEKCALRSGLASAFPRPGCFLKLECGCIGVGVDWGTPELYAELLSSRLLPWLADDKIKCAIQIARALNASA